jgi:uncharacterized phage-associated protein
MPISAKTVASALLYEAGQMGIADVSNMKLQKLLYDTQGYHLALFDERAFSEDISAWPYGTVIEPIYHEYKTYGSLPIPSPQEKPDIPEPIWASIRHALTGRGTKSAIELSNENHTEDPWKEAWPITRVIQRLINKYGSAKLKDSTMKTLFTRKFIKRQTATDQAPDEGGLCLDLAAWKELEAKLSAPPSDALRRFMATPSTVSDELEQILLERQRAHA